MIFWKLTIVLAFIAITVNIKTSYGKESYPAFGRTMREEFLLAPNYISLNHGSYGTYPKFVRTALHAYLDRAENNPDVWIRRDLPPLLENVRQQLATLMNCDPEDLVMVPNTTGGMNAVFRSMIFAFGDKILHFNNVYYAMRSVIQYVSDHSNGNVTVVEFNVQYPISNDELLNNLEEFIIDNLPIKIALIDHISSTPSIVLPIDRIIPMLKRYDIKVLIDGAHAIGQIPIDIKSLAPDYYITNCHKWLYSVRGSAVMYVEKSLQGLIHPAQISGSYARPANFQDEFFWTGTMDYSPYMTITSALEFRKAIGGDEIIRNYTHKLALAGGQLVAQKLGTEIIQVSNDQIANMVDVELPLLNPNDPILNSKFWLDQQLNRFNIYCATYKYEGIWWTRLSAQIYNDITDFEVAANAFLTICNELNYGDSNNISTWFPEATTSSGSSRIRSLFEL